jgi:hypothetical protein
MFDISYKRIYNKQRRGQRGPKQRYAVFRAELNLKREEEYKISCESYCNRNDLNIEDYKIEDNQFPWAMTWEYISALHKFWPYNFNGENCFKFYLGRPSEIEKIKNNIEIAEKLKIEKEEKRKLSSM